MFCSYAASEFWVHIFKAEPSFTRLLAKQAPASRFPSQLCAHSSGFTFLSPSNRRVWHFLSSWTAGLSRLEVTSGDRCEHVLAGAPERIAVTFPFLLNCSLPLELMSSFAFC